jgi:Zn-dependent alcohol dehydrogenase
MKAAVLRAFNEPMKVEDIQVPDPQKDEVKVRITASGLCHTDISTFQGGLPAPLPVVLGHEGTGIVDSVGELVSDLKPGDKVLINALVYDGTCPNCLRGPLGSCVKNGYFMFGGNMRDDRTRLHKGKEVIHSYFCQSSFAEFALTHRDFVIKLPKDVDETRLAPLCCGGVSGIGAVINRAKVAPGSSVAVLGCGVVGIGAIMAAKVAGAAKIIAIDVLDAKLKLVARFGATDIVNSSKTNPVDAVREMTGGLGSDYAIEAIGKPETVSMALDMIDAGGTAVDVGVVPFGAKIPIDAIQLVGEKALMGSVIGTLKPQIDIPKYVALYKQGRLPVDKMVQAEYTLEQINQAIADIERGSSFIKAIIRPS